MPIPCPIRVLASPAEQPDHGNPYVTALYAAVTDSGAVVDEFTRRRLLDGYDIVHVHWPENLVRWTGVATAAGDVVKVLAGLAVARLRGSKLVWTGHDLGPHDMRYPRLYRAYIAGFVRLVSLLISLGDAATDRLRATYPGLRAVPVRTVPHGHYRGLYPDPPNPETARARLGIPQDAVVYLLLGQIRRYKNVPALVDAFVRSAAVREHLAVAGEVREDSTLTGELIEASGHSEALTLSLGRIPAVDVPTWHAAADVVVLPYSQGTSLHSGAALLALSLNRPVVVPDSGTMRELQSVAGNQWVWLFAGGPADALRAARDVAETARPGAVDLAALDWPGLGEATVDAYRSVLTPRRATRTAAPDRSPGPRQT